MNAIVFTAVNTTSESLTDAEYRLLEALREDPHLSQRRLAGRLGIALGLTNKMLQMLVRKGYVNIENLGRNRMGYLLTTKGVAEKGSRLLSHLQNTAALFRQARQLVLASLDLKRTDPSTLKCVAVYGCGDVGELVYHTLKAEGVSRLVFVDPEFQGRAFLGQKVFSEEEAAAEAPDLLFVATPRPVDEAALRAKGLTCPVFQFPSGLDMPTGTGVTPVEA